MSALGVGVAGGSAADMTAVTALCSFATNVFGGFGVDALKRLYSSCIDRPGRPIDENHTILRNLRAAQLHAISDVMGRFDRICDDDSDRERAAAGAQFSQYFWEYHAREESRVSTLTAADLVLPTEADAASMRAALIARAPADFNASLSARHGVGPAIDAFRVPAEAAMLAELREVHAVVPASVENLIIGGRDSTDGWFALFIRDAAKRLRENAEFERIWQAEQTAAIRVLSEQTGTDISALRGAIDGHTAELAAFGSQLDEIAGDTKAVRTLMADIAGRLDDTRDWLIFNSAFQPDGWKRFHAFNRAIPFQGREGELADLQAFLTHAEPFRWWTVTAPGGAGKTRLALELCLRAHVNGWHVGFLQKPLIQPASAWRPQAPTLIIADYAAEQVEALRAFALRLCQVAERERPVVRLLLLERQVDEVFWQRFLGSSGKEAGTLEAQRHVEAPLQVPELSEDDIWALVRSCPWRSDGRMIAMERVAFFAYLEVLDARRRALVAMLLADAMAETTGQPSFATLNEVMAALVRQAREHHWPHVLGAALPTVGRAVPADALIAAATMAGSLQREEIDAIGVWLEIKISGEIIDECARAIGSPLYPKTKRLDGIQPDLIGEYFALAALTGDERDDPPFPWLPELAWRANEVAMAAFVTRARQNFPDHQRALSLVEITVPGVTESWWLDVLLTLAGDLGADLVSRLQAAHDRLIGPAMTDGGAAGAFARLCWFATGLDRSILPFSIQDRFVQSALDLPVQTRTDVMREGLAASLFNMLTHAKAEDGLERRDGLLQELRALAASCRSDEAVRTHLAMGLLNTLNHAKAEDALERRDGLLQELRDLAASYPLDEAVRTQLAMGLFNTLNHAKAEDALERRDGLLQELRDLAASYPLDEAVRKPLAMGLFNTLVDAKAEDALERRDGLLQELRDLAASYPLDEAVRTQLAMGLFNTLNHAKAEDALERRDGLLQELRDLAASYPLDEAVRTQLAEGLVNTLVHAKAEDALERRDGLLQELRDLAASYPLDEAMRTRLARGLFNTLNDAKAEDALERRDGLLQELRDLAASYPLDEAVRTHLAMGLFNTLNDAKAEDALERRDGLLQELRDLAASYPLDEAVRTRLARGLFNTLNDAKAEDALERRDGLLQELRDLAASYPLDEAVRTPLARGLFNTLNDAKAEDGLERRDGLLQELRDLAASYPLDEAVREQFINALILQINELPQTIGGEELNNKTETLITEIMSLSELYPDDTFLSDIVGLLNQNRDE